MSRTSDRYLRVNADAQSAAKCGGLDPAYFSPLGNGFCFPIDGDTPVCPSVVGLLNCGSPAAIAGHIAQAIVDPIYGKLFRGFPHILKEVCKILPFCTNGYSPSPVGREFVVVRALASCFHIGPNVVGSGPFFAGKGKPMPMVLCGSEFGEMTPARNGHTLQKAVSVNISNVAAKAIAGVVMLAGRCFGDRPSAKRRTNLEFAFHV